MDFDFVEVHRVKEFSFRPASRSEDEDLCSGNHSTTEDGERSLTQNRQSKQTRHSVWNVDGEIINEPAIHVR